MEANPTKQSQASIIFFDSSDPIDQGFAWRSGDDSGRIDCTKSVRYLEAVESGELPEPGDRDELLAELKVEGLCPETAEFVDSNGQNIGQLFPEL